MSALDVIVVVSIAGLAALGFKRGFIKELIETGGALVAAVIAFRYHQQTLEVFGVAKDATFGVKVGAFLALFVVCMILFSLIGYVLRKFVRSISLGMYDSLAGFVLGAVKGGVAGLALTTGLMWGGDAGKDIVSESKYARANALVFSSIVQALPEPVRKKYDSVIGLYIPPELSGQRGVTALGALDSGAIGSSMLEGVLAEWSDSTHSGRITYDSDGTTCSVEVERYKSAGAQFSQGARVRFRLAYTCADRRVTVREMIPKEPE